jgi:hypothetical protein
VEGYNGSTRTGGTIAMSAREVGQKLLPMEKKITGGKLAFPPVISFVKSRK